MEAPGTPPEKGLGVIVAGTEPGQEILIPSVFPKPTECQQSVPDVKFSEWLPEPPADPVFLRRFMRIRWEVGGTAFVLVAIWCRLIYAFFHMKHAAFLSPLMQILTPLSVLIWMYARSRRASPQLADLLDLPPVCPQFPVELTYRSTATAYGKDQGIVSLFDGWMHFQGRRTSWSLTTNELKRPRWTRHTANSGVLAAVKSSPAFHRFKWNDGKEELVIVMFPMDEIEGLGRGLQKKFDQAIVPWFNAPSMASGALVWPPTTAAPGMVRRREAVRTCWILVLWASRLPFAVALMAYFGGNWPWWWALLAVFPWFFAEIIVAYASKSLVEVNDRSQGAERIDFRLPARPWWTRIGLKL